MEINKSFSKMTKKIVEKNYIKHSPFKIIDVGCSGGLSQLWRNFDPYLQALGVDPVKSECERLTKLETNKNIHYYSSFVGLPDEHDFVLKRNKKLPYSGCPWNRLSSQFATEIMNQKIAKDKKLEILNDWHNSDLVDVNKKIGITDLANKFSMTDLDFIKIDIDSYDLDALISSEEIQRSSPVLGYALEVNFYGSNNDTDHTFHNTDKIMRSAGFDLFDLSVRRYSSRQLPAMYAIDGPAQTIIGRPFQGDAIYLRDPMSKGTDGAPKCPDLTEYKLIKLACLFELFGLPDHAAELVEGYSSVLKKILDINEILDILTEEVAGKKITYNDYMNLFEQDPTKFYTSNFNKLMDF
jgi:hypothetical protein